MATVIIRTKLQAVIVRSMLAQGLLQPPIYLMQFHESDSDATVEDMAHQRELFGSAVSRSSQHTRRRLGTFRLTALLAYQLLIARIRREAVYFANLNWSAFALALKLIPGIRFFSFDDGTANIEQRRNSYLSEAPTSRGGFSGKLMRFLFPKGCAHFARSRIIRHSTIYPYRSNVVSSEKIDFVRVDWDSLISERDKDAFPPSVERILIGAVYESVNQRPGVRLSQEDIDKMVQWADLYIPHPRQAGPATRNELIVRYPAEAIISFYAKRQRITVAHYGSSCVIPFERNPNVRLLNALHDMP